jgi:hypothetical protein
MLQFKPHERYRSKSNDTDEDGFAAQMWVGREVRGLKYRVLLDEEDTSYGVATK